MHQQIEHMPWMPGIQMIGWKEIKWEWGTGFDKLIEEEVQFLDCCRTVSAMVADLAIIKMMGS